MSSTDLHDTTAPWASVVGQAEAVRRLQAAVAAPVHAYLFVGPAGAGKMHAARVFAGELAEIRAA